jgi:hypothetical protein
MPANNFEGKMAGKNAEMNVAQLDMGIDASGQSFVRIRNLEIRRFNQAGVVVCDGTNAVVRDNYIYYCGQGLNCGSTVDALIHRNIISDIMTVGMGSGGVQGIPGLIGVSCGLKKGQN